MKKYKFFRWTPNTCKLMDEKIWPSLLKKIIVFKFVVLKKYLDFHFQKIFLGTLGLMRIYFIFTKNARKKYFSQFSQNQRQ